MTGLEDQRLLVITRFPPPLLPSLPPPLPSLIFSMSVISPPLPLDTKDTSGDGERGKGGGGRKGPSCLLGRSRHVRWYGRGGGEWHHQWIGDSKDQRSSYDYLESDEHDRYEVEWNARFSITDSIFLRKKSESSYSLRFYCQSWIMWRNIPTFHEKRAIVGEFLWLFSVEENSHCLRMVDVEISLGKCFLKKPVACDVRRRTTMCFCIFEKNSKCWISYDTRWYSLVQGKFFYYSLHNLQLRSPSLFPSRLSFTGTSFALEYIQFASSISERRKGRRGLNLPILNKLTLFLSLFHTQCQEQSRATSNKHLLFPSDPWLPTWIRPIPFPRCTFSSSSSTEQHQLRRFETESKVR